MIIRLDI